MKTNFNIILFTVSIIVIANFTISCKKEAEIAAPSISIQELGYQNTKRAFRGNDLHIEAYLLAEGKIANVMIELHPESGHLKQVDNLLSPLSWEFDSTYTGKYYGIKNTDFHEHIEIPLSADTGHYHFHFSVTDMEGNRTTFEDEVHVIDSLNILK